jgi:peptidoglycan/LPS O-acetylase OafA/YrhL
VRRVPALDALRGVAVLLVLATHTPRLIDRSPDALAESGVLRFMSHGMFGVDIFFVLSGFLIASLLLEEHARAGTVDLRGFYRRRVRRLLPAAAALFVAHGVYATYAGLSLHREAVAAVSGLSGTANYVMAFRPGEYGPQFVHLWSLAIEMQFYVLFPVVLVATVRWRWWPLIVAGAAAGSLVWRFVIYDSVGPFAAFWRTDTHADPILIGVLCGWYWTRYRPTIINKSAVLASAGFAVVLCMGYAQSWFVSRVGFTIVAVAAALVVLAVADIAVRVEPFRTIGVVSYGLYLWHLPIFAAVSRTDLPAVTRVATAWGASGLAAVLSWWLVERRYMNARKPDSDVMFVENM